MKRNWIAAAAAALTMAAPAAPKAHHSTAMFDWGSEREIEHATVVRWDWTNPHTFLYIEADDGAGGVKTWALEGMSPNHLGRHGWSRKSLKAGDKINVIYYPLRDGRKGGFAVKVTFEDGASLTQLPAR